MKTIEELGISPAPWNVSVEDKRDYRLFSVEADNGAGITCFDCCEEQFDNHEGFANASLIAAAPDLYKCLHDAIMAICRMCPHCSVHQSYECNEPKRKCCANVWRKVLSDAAEGKARNE